MGNEIVFKSFLTLDSALVTAAVMAFVGGPPTDFTSFSQILSIYGSYDVFYFSNTPSEEAIEAITAYWNNLLKDSSEVIDTSTVSDEDKQAAALDKAAKRISALAKLKSAASLTDDEVAAL